MAAQKYTACNALTAPTAPHQRLVQELAQVMRLYHLLRLQNQHLAIRLASQLRQLWCRLHHVSLFAQWDSRLYTQTHLNFPSVGPALLQYFQLRRLLRQHLQASLQSAKLAHYLHSQRQPTLTLTALETLAQTRLDTK
jgi:hypothetical protein